MALTEPGLTRRDRLSHVAGDAPLACCLSLHLTAVSWMRPDNGLRRRCESPFLGVTPDARVQEHYSRYSGSGRFILPVGVRLHLRPVVLRGERAQWPVALWAFPIIALFVDLCFNSQILTLNIEHIHRQIHPWDQQSLTPSIFQDCDFVKENVSSQEKEKTASTEQCETNWQYKYIYLYIKLSHITNDNSIYVEGTDTWYSGTPRPPVSIPPLCG